MSDQELKETEARLEEERKAYEDSWAKYQQLRAAYRIWLSNASTVAGGELGRE